MKKFEFSLEKIRDYKNSVLSRETGVLAGLRMEKNNIENRIILLDENFDSINEEMNDKFKAGLTVSQIRIYDYRMSGIREEKRLLNDRLDFLEVSIKRQLTRVMKLKQEVSGYDKLEEKQREEYSKAVLKENELVISEFVSQKMTRELNENG